MHRFAASPALTRLEWVLDGLDGKPGWGADAAEVFAAGFRAVVTPERYVDVTRERAARYAPVVVVGLDVGETTARARIRRHDGTVDVVTCVVESTPPHRIASTWVIGLVPDDLTPRLPADFTGHDLPAAANARLVVFSGVPGSGKSTLADAAGAELGDSRLRHRLAARRADPVRGPPLRRPAGPGGGGADHARPAAARGGPVRDPRPPHRVGRDQGPVAQPGASGGGGIPGGRVPLLRPGAAPRQGRGPQPRDPRLA